MDNLLTARQVQELLNVDRTTIYRMLKDGRLAGVKVGQHWRFSSREVSDMLGGTPQVAEPVAPVSLDVLPLHCMQPVQDVFAEIAEVGAVTTDTEGKPVTRISNSCDFCKLILGSENGREACMRSWAQLTKQSDPSPQFTHCHAGLQYARAYIEVNGELIALLISGQFYAEAPDQEEEVRRIQSLSKTYNIDESLLRQAAEKISVLDQRKVTQIRTWLDKVAHTFEQISTERCNLMGRLRQIAEMSVFEDTLS
ncbi:MAG: PocR ligand-binding domain-containing protein [Anaerolineales bacterium]|uniref:PocR ligand-binding domain-containing protein n=1 Tax=Candidatus Villigracilis vicinus TaxID=3140679 RepID=UPI003135A26B|nr:PocR ligand-binding domain-containing protein [Anaerolineales bacterium]